jgi:hypothetical protein
VTVLNRLGAVVPVETSEMGFESPEAVVKIPVTVTVGPSMLGR